MKGTLAADFARAFNTLVAKEPKNKQDHHTASAFKAPPLSQTAKAQTWHGNDFERKKPPIPSSYTTSHVGETPRAWNPLIKESDEKKLIAQAWRTVHEGITSDELRGAKRM